MKILNYLPSLQPNKTRHSNILQQLKIDLESDGDLKMLLNNSIKLIERPSSRQCYLERLNIIKCVRDLPNEYLSWENLKRTLGLSKPALVKWINRFSQKIHDWFKDAKRSGRPSVVTDEQLTQIHRALHASPKDFVSEVCNEHQDALSISSLWTYNTLSVFTKVKPSTLWRKLQSLNIKSLSKASSWCLSLDPQYVVKTEKIHELYSKAKSSDDIVVLCLDEKTCIQALSYKTFVTHEGKRYIDCRYQRNGVAHLIASLNVATGEVYHEWLDTKTKADISQYISRICNLPEFKGKQIYLVLDNLSSHKNFQTIDANWYERHSNVEFVFTPTCSSWMNLIESTFGLITRKVLKGRSWQSVDELKNAVDKYIEVMNKHCKPYNWSLDIARNKSQRVHTLSSMAQTLGLDNIKILLDAFVDVYGEDHPIMRQCPIDYLNGAARINCINVKAHSHNSNSGCAVEGVRDYRTSFTVIK